MRKKIVSIVLAVMMIASSAVPSFAATITKESDPKTADVQVKTKTTDKNDSDPETYTVTIPADITVAWNDTAAQDASYTVDSQLKLGAKLKVSAAANDAGKMTNAATDKFLTFTVAGGDVAEYPELNNAVKSSTTDTIAVIGDGSVPSCCCNVNVDGVLLIYYLGSSLNGSVAAEGVRNGIAVIGSGFHSAVGRSNRNGKTFVSLES